MKGEWMPVAGDGSAVLKCVYGKHTQYDVQHPA